MFDEQSTISIELIRCDILSRLVGERVAGGQADVTISSTELQQEMAVAKTAGGEEELLAGMQSEEEGDLVMDI